MPDPRPSVPPASATPTGRPASPLALGTDHNHAPRAKISNLQLRHRGQIVPGADVHVIFDLEWDGAWRRAADDAPGNWNALWVFIKFRATKLHDQPGIDQVVRMCTPDLMKMPPVERNELRRQVKTRVLDMIEARRQTSHANDVIRLDLPREVHTRAGHGRPPTDVDVSRDETVKIAIAPGSDTNSVVVREAQEMLPWDHAKVVNRADKHGAYVGDRVDERLQIIPTEDQTGAFIQLAPNAEGFHERIRSRIHLFWDTPDDIRAPAVIEVHALHMIYVPPGDYALGEPANPEGFQWQASFHASQARTNAAGEEDWSYPVTSEAEIEVAKTTASTSESNSDTKMTHADLEANANDSTRPSVELAWNADDEEPGHGCANIPAPFPKGHQGFYCMRDQVTQGEYADFLNTLSGDALTMRFPYDGQGNNRFTIFRAIKGSALRKATRPNRPCSYLAWSDGTAFLWWAGLRPMTELEYEKCCRGPAAAVTKEYAWGNTNLAQGTVILGDESRHPIMTGNCNIDNAYSTFSGGDGESGPVDGGSFSTTGTHVADPLFTRHTSNRTLFEQLPSKTDEPIPDYTFVPGTEVDYREQTGSSYYHVMSLSGNLWELLVSAGTDEGRQFTGVHGTGKLDHLGDPDYASLDSDNGDGETTRPWPESYGARGGSWYTTASRGRTANRSMASGIPGYDYRSYDFGIRGVRTAPRVLRLEDEALEGESEDAEATTSPAGNTGSDG